MCEKFAYFCGDLKRNKSFLAFKDIKKITYRTNTNIMPYFNIKIFDNLLVAKILKLFLKNLFVFQNFE